MSLVTRSRILNFLLPGAGMCLLGKWRLAALNVVLAALAVSMALVWGGVLVDEIHYVWLVIASGSAGWAHAVAANLGEQPLSPRQSDTDL